MLLVQALDFGPGKILKITVTVLQGNNKMKCIFLQLKVSAIFNYRKIHDTSDESYDRINQKDQW